MNPNEISILSDDLRPRDTPNHTLLKDFALKPMVPDLSVTEEPESKEPLFSNRCQQPAVLQENPVTNRPKPLLEDCKTYSEWRKKCALNAVPQPTANHHCENSYVHYLGGMAANPTVLDNLNSPVETYDSHSVSNCSKRPSSHLASYSNGRPSIIQRKDCQISGTSSKVSQSDPRTQKNWEAVPVHMNPQRRKSGIEESPPRKDSNSRAPGGQSYSQSPANANFDDSYKHHPETANCMGCVHWPHQPMTAVNYSGMPVYHPYAHMGMPLCNGMPVKTNSALPVPSPKSKSVSRRSGGVLGNSFDDSVVYDNLYQTVLSQSEQLRMLQTQVEKLLIRQENHRCSGLGTGNRRSITVMERGTQTSDGESNTDDNKKMSIGVMTSFIHTVAYTGRVGLVDSRSKGSNQPRSTMDARNKIPNGQTQLSTSPPSQTPPTSSSSSVHLSPRMAAQNNCCKCHECIDKEKKNQKRKQRGNPERMTPLDRLEEAFGGKGPGVSAAIRTVRDCQAALENESFPNEGDNGRSDHATGVDESITLNGVELPTVVELPVSPPSSMHIDVQEYDHSSSSEDRSSSNEFSSMSESDVDDSDSQQHQRNGWSNYNNILGPVNHLRQNKDSVDDDCDKDYYSRRGKSRKGPAERENRPPRLPANGPQVSSVLKRVAFQHETNSKADESADNLKELALKFLRENYPEELKSTEEYISASKSSGSHKRVQNMALYNAGNNMSFATFRYLERYNLLPDNLKINRIEELPGYSELPTNVENRGTLTNGSPSRNGNGLAAQFEQHGRYTLRTPKDMANDRVSRPYRKEKLNESPNGRRQSSKVRHKRHFRQNANAPTHSNGQQPSSTAKILDITALRQQPKLL